MIFSERGRGLSAAAVQLWVHRLYTSLGLAGCSSHSGRLTFYAGGAQGIGSGGKSAGLGLASFHNATYDMTKPSLTSSAQARSSAARKAGDTPAVPRLDLDGRGAAGPKPKLSRQWGPATSTQRGSRFPRALQDGHFKENRGPLDKTRDDLSIEMRHTLDLAHVKAPAQGKITVAIPPQIILREVLV